MQMPRNNKNKGKAKNKKHGNQKENPKPTTNENDKGKRNAKYPYLLCGGDHFMKECPHHEEINQFLKTNPGLYILMYPFPSQQQLIDHMSNQGKPSSLEEFRMMSSDTINLQTRIHNYDKPIEKKEDNSSSGKSPSISSPESSSTSPLTIEKPNLDRVLLGRLFLTLMPELPSFIM